MQSVRHIPLHPPMIIVFMTINLSHNNVTLVVSACNSPRWCLIYSSMYCISACRFTYKLLLENLVGTRQAISYLHCTFRGATSCRGEASTEQVLRPPLRMGNCYDEVLSRVTRTVSPILYSHYYRCMVLQTQAKLVPPVP